MAGVFKHAQRPGNHAPDHLVVDFFPNLEALSQAAAELLVQRAHQAVAEHDRFSVALAGGHTPRRTYELLAQDPWRIRLPWAKVHVFWGDERCVPPDNPASNEGMARAVWLDHAPIPPAQIHPMRCARAPRLAAADYEAILRAFFANQRPAFDLVLLGLGPDGHTASLFPGTAALEEQERWVTEVRVAGQDIDRITLTAPLINQAGLVVFLVSGADKAAPLQAVLKGPRDPHRWPAQLIQPVRGELRWLVDRATISD